MAFFYERVKDTPKMLATDHLGLCLLIKSDATDFEVDERLTSKWWTNSEFHSFGSSLKNVYIGES